MRTISIRKFISFGLVLLITFALSYTLYFNTNLYIKFGQTEVTTFTKTDNELIYLLENGKYEPFEIRGVNVGAGVPGHFATDYAITKEEYLSWFSDIKAMGANSIRVYTVLGPAFYEAVYEFNTGNDEPLYIIHGLWLNDYMHYSHRDAYDKDILGALKRDAVMMVDVIWGQRSINLGAEAGTGSYRKNISPWVIGYILGVEWEEFTVIYTDEKYKDVLTGYQGDYMYTTPEASSFEMMLAELGDSVIEYETKRYGVQRLISFSNWPTTDPFDYSDAVIHFFTKVAKVDVERIRTTDAFISGAFASYHVYPYYPDYLTYDSGLTGRLDSDGNINTYYAYLEMLNEHHHMPVVIAEYGIPSSRGMAQYDLHTGRNQGNMSEEDQAEALIHCYKDIMDAGSAGSIVFAWQDEWFKRTWNTMHSVDLYETAYWSDYQTNEQSFGLLSFDPGEVASIVYVDGDVSDWNGTEPLFIDDDVSMSMQYDEKFLYFMVKAADLEPEKHLYIPLDITPKTGTKHCDNFNLDFNSEVDFVMHINGAESSRIVVQDRYCNLRATHGSEVLGINPYMIHPEKDSTRFESIDMILQMTTLQSSVDVSEMSAGELELLEASLYETFETGKLLEGNGNPNSDDFNSLADFAYGSDCVEIRIPWQLLNFSNPNMMMIHDDYYEHYGVESIEIEEMYVGAVMDPMTEDIIQLTAFPLEGWGTNVTYHERLKESYYAYQRIWTESGVGK